jgi:hypothetical protein
MEFLVECLEVFKKRHGIGQIGHRARPDQAVAPVVQLIEKWLRASRCSQGQIMPEQQENEWLCCEIAKLKADVRLLVKHPTIWPLAWLCDARGYRGRVSVLG